MTPEETAKALNNLAKQIAERLPEITERVALDAKALIQERIQERGLNAEEVSLTPYSDEYKKVRENNNLFSDHVSLTLTGQMWRNTEITNSGFEGGKYVVTIGGLAEASKNKLTWNSDHYGDVLRLSKKEENKLQERINKSIDIIIKESGL